MFLFVKNVKGVKKMNEKEYVFQFKRFVQAIRNFLEGKPAEGLRVFKIDIITGKRTEVLNQVKLADIDDDNCTTCEFYFANAELDIGLCRLDKYESIDLDNAVNSCCKDYERWKFL